MRRSVRDSGKLRMIHCGQGFWQPYHSIAVEGVSHADRKVGGFSVLGKTPNVRTQKTGLVISIFRCGWPADWDARADMRHSVTDLPSFFIGPQALEFNPIRVQ